MANVLYMAANTLLSPLDETYDLLKWPLVGPFFLKKRLPIGRAWHPDGLRMPRHLLRLRCREGLALPSFLPLCIPFFPLIGASPLVFISFRMEFS